MEMIMNIALLLTNMLAEGYIDDKRAKAKGEANGEQVARRSQVPLIGGPISGVMTRGGKVFERLAVLAKERRGKNLSDIPIHNRDA
ncbi:hypothetical protein DM860_011487 [Cuscuta australis]|uniref:Uncharacterized protein n=1 Tax=Cuscuta australis TaxID=267555 RepID=A0A328D3K8_9ASTE|nr:hypothetical protein DM860_011487 [Cuscuta australis]